MNIRNFWHSMNNSSICPQTINCTKNYPGQTNNQRNSILCKDSAQRKKFSNKIWCQRQCHITLSKDEKANAEQWHCCCTPSKIFLSFCMGTIIQIPNTLKQSRTSNSMRLHCKDRTNNSDFVHCKQSKNNHAHMCNTTIGNNFFQINLSKSCQTCVNNSNLTNSGHKRCKIRTCTWKEIKIKAQKSICSKFQQNSGQQNTSCSTSFNMGFWQPLMKWHQWNLYCKGQKESPPHNILTTFRKPKMSYLFIVSCSCSTQQELKNWQHCQTSNKCIKNLQIGSLYFSCSTSTQSNKQKHWNQRTFIKNIKTKNIQTCETCKKKTFKTKSLCIKRLAMCILCVPTALNCLRHQNSCQQNHPKIQSIQTKFQRECQKTTPICTKSDNLLEWNNCVWNKTRPQTHTQKQSSLTKKQSKKTMFFSFFSWKTTKKKSSPQRKKLYNRKLTIKRNALKQRCTQNTKSKNLRPHLNVFQKKCFLFQWFNSSFCEKKEKKSFFWTREKSAADRFELSSWDHEPHKVTTPPCYVSLWILWVAMFYKAQSKT